jgi:hypothetical protein
VRPRAECRPSVQHLLLNQRDSHPPIQACAQDRTRPGSAGRPPHRRQEHLPRRPQGGPRRNAGPPPTRHAVGAHAAAPAAPAAGRPRGKGALRPLPSAGLSTACVHWRAVLRGARANLVKAPFTHAGALSMPPPPNRDRRHNGWPSAAPSHHSAPARRCGRAARSWPTASITAPGPAPCMCPRPQGSGPSGPACRCGP